MTKNICDMMEKLDETLWQFDWHAKSPKKSDSLEQQVEQQNKQPWTVDPVYDKNWAYCNLTETQDWNQWFHPLLTLLLLLLMEIRGVTSQ